MSDNKKYYYLKLKDDFFDSDAMVVLESMPDGYKYSNILLKLYLRSLKNEGKLMFNDRIPYNSNILAQVTRHSVGDVERAIQVFKELDLIEILDNGAIFITDIQNFIGQSSTEADRKRAYRNRIEQEKQQLLSNKVQMSNDKRDKCPDKSPPEIDIEIEREIELEEVRSPAKAEPQIPYKEIIEYLNQKAERSFRHSTAKTKSLIKARYNEGFSQENFEKVIDIKVDQWKNKPDMEKYLRPETLFGTKFEGYLNEQYANSSKDRSWEEWDFLD